MKYIYLFLIAAFILLTSASAPNSSIGGIGGQAVFDSTAQRFKIKSLEINHYLNANSLKPGDLILEIDKVPIHKMSYGEVLKLVQGTVGTQMSLKVLRYNAIEKYYQINRIRVTLDMNPVWWSVPDYKYYNLSEGINHTISQLKVNGKNAIDTVKIPNNKDRVYCNYSVRGAYESTFLRNAKGRYVWNCGFVKTEDKARAEGTYNYLVLQLKNYSLKNAKLIKTESLNAETKTYSIRTNEVSDISLTNLNMNVKLKKEFDKDENKDLWKVEMDVNI